MCKIPTAGRRLPIADVEVAVSSDAIIAKAKSDSSGLFTVQLPESVGKGREVTLQFRHPAYQPLDLHEFVSDKLYIAQMAPVGPKSSNIIQLAGDDDLTGAGEIFDQGNDHS